MLNGLACSTRNAASATDAVAAGRWQWLGHRGRRVPVRRAADRRQGRDRPLVTHSAECQHTAHIGSRRSDYAIHHSQVHLFSTLVSRQLLIIIVVTPLANLHTGPQHGGTVDHDRRVFFQTIAGRRLLRQLH